MAGRGQFKFGTTEALREKVANYFIQCEDDGDVPSLPGICLFLDIHRDTFWYYASGQYQERLSQKAKAARQESEQNSSDEDISENKADVDLHLLDGYIGMDEVDAIKADVSDIFKKARERMERWWLKTGLGLKNPAFAIFYMKNAFGYSDNPNAADTDKPQVLEVRLSIQPPDSPQQLASAQPKPLPVIQVLPDKPQQD